MFAHIIFLFGITAAIFLIIVWELRLCISQNTGTRYLFAIRGSITPDLKNTHTKYMRRAFLLVIIILGVILYGMLQIQLTRMPRLHIVTAGDNPDAYRRRNIIPLDFARPTVIGGSIGVNPYYTSLSLLRGEGIARRHARLAYNPLSHTFEIEKLDEKPVIVTRGSVKINLGESSDTQCVPLRSNDEIRLGNSVLRLEIPTLFELSPHNGLLLWAIFSCACLVTLYLVKNQIKNCNYFLYPTVVLLSGLGVLMMYKLSVGQNTLTSGTKQYVVPHLIKVCAGLFSFLVVVRFSRASAYWRYLWKWGVQKNPMVQLPYYGIRAFYNRLQGASKKYAGQMNTSRRLKTLFSDAQDDNPYDTAHYLLIASVMLLLLPIPFGGQLGINFKFMRIQPVEFVKILLIYYFTILICIYLTRAVHPSSLSTRFRLISPILIVMIIPSVMLAMMHDFGPILLLYALILTLFYIGSARLLEPLMTTALLLCTCILFIMFKPDNDLSSVMFLRGENKHWVFIIYFLILTLFLLINPRLRRLGIVSMLGFAFLEIGLHFGVIRHEHFHVITERLMIWQNPWNTDKGLQLARSLWLIKDAGWLGAGFHWSDFSVLPPAFHTDFIFSVICATFGFAGVLIIFTCYTLIAYAGLKIIASPFDGITSGIRQSMIIAGIFFSICFQAFVIIAGNVKCLPLTGITLPLLSYGGSSLMATFILIGLMFRYTLHVSGEG